MKKKIGFGVIMALLFVLLFSIVDFRLAASGPLVKFCDLSQILSKKELTNEDYRLIFQQTGLGKTAVEDLKKTSDDFITQINEFQCQYFKSLNYKQLFMFFPTTTAEVLCDEEGNLRRLELPPLRDGDILITKSTKTLFYRHGHSALITDAEAEKTLEAFMIGYHSEIMDMETWRYYPTVLILRPKNLSPEAIDRMIAFSKDKLVGVPYRLLTGVVQKDKSTETVIDSTQCAHLVWQAYKKEDVDIDSDNGLLVTPRDMASSPEFDVVFSFGFGKKQMW